MGLLLSGLHTVAGHVDDRDHALGLITDLSLLELGRSSRRLHRLLCGLLHGALCRLLHGLLLLRISAALLVEDCLLSSLGGLPERFRLPGRLLGHHTRLGLLECVCGSRLGRLLWVALWILTLRILALHTRHIALLGIALLRILLGIALLLRILLRIALLLRILLGIALLRILLRITLLLRILLGIALLLRILSLHARHVALLRIARLSLHGLLAAQLVHHLPDDTTQHAASHGTCHGVHSRLAIVLPLWIARLTISIGYCG